MVLQHIFYGLILVALGVVTLRFNFQIVQNTTRLAWFEEHLGAGSTFLVYKIGSVGMVLFGILLMTGLSGAFLDWLFSPVRSLFNINR